MTRTSTTYPLLIVVAALWGWSLASVGYAAQLSFTTSPEAPAAGEVVTIVVKLDTQQDSLNAIEGSVSIPKEFVVERIHTGGSGLQLWPVEPHVGSSGVEFVGGAQGGIPVGSTITLFTIVAKAPTPGSYPITLSSARGFRNDGLGSSVAVLGAPLTLVVAGTASREESQPKDVTAPEFVSVEIGQEPSLFDGLRYLSFFATDDQSGVSYYEVKEGWFGRYIKADRYYVLTDQQLESPVWVRAVDGAGNYAVEKISPQYTSYTLAYWIGGILVVVAFVLGLYLRRLWR